MNLCETHTIGAKTRELICYNIDPLNAQGISMVGLSDAAPPYRMVRLKGGSSHILACLGGKGRVWVNGGWKAVGPGDVYLSPPQTIQAFHVEKGCRWQFAWVFYARPPGEFSGLVPMVIRAEGRPLEMAIRGLHDEMQSFADEAVLSCHAQLIRMACARFVGGKKSSLRLSSLWQKVAANPVFAWSSPRLSREAGISDEHLRRLCHAETGRSPMQHVTYLRLQKAAILLQTTSLRIQAVAEAVGYTDPFAFSTAFKRHLGCRPSTFSQSPSASGRR